MWRAHGAIMALCVINQSVMRGSLREKWGLLQLWHSKDPVGGSFRLPTLRSIIQQVHLKGNHYPNKKPQHILHLDHQFYVITMKEWDIFNLSCGTEFAPFSLIPFPPKHLQYLLTLPPACIFYSLSSLCSSYMFYTLFPPFPSLSLSLCVVSFLTVCARNLVGGRHEEHSHVSQRELREMNKLTLLALEKVGGKEHQPSPRCYFFPPFSLYLPFLNSRQLSGLQYTQAITVQHPGCRGEKSKRIAEFEVVCVAEWWVMR